ncbi:MAG: bis(5'-nucleosyl)-tetraphosphatase (symmetrical) YqeK [Atribacterota bacterium]|jgi:predicted HD superfamily hydrolase involved in NAD metabolism|nr:bis(5'-nucleosyl)-tetraphosphatase (symmetrical) YqeK [Atribacterota bacterium]
MMNLEQIDNKLKEMMTKTRYQHACRVSLLAQKIAEYYNLPIQKTMISALTHDCAKDYSLEELKNLVDKYNIKLNKVEKSIPKIWHAYVGAEMVKDIFMVDDWEILDAIRYHSTASSKLGLIGKIVYIADKIEPNRKLAKIRKLHEKVWEDIDMAMLELLNMELQYLICNKLIIHPDTLKARNKILMDRRVFEIGKIR